MLKKILRWTIVLIVATLLSSGTVLADSSFNWRQCEGQTINLLLNKHLWTESTAELFPEFEKMTGIKLKYQILPEEEYFEKLLIDLSTRAGTYDAFMTGPVLEWQYSYAGWIKPLDEFLNNPDLTSPDYEPQDFIPAVLNNHRWSGRLGDPVGTGSLWAIPVQVESHILYYNKELLKALGLTIPTTYSELAETARKATRIFKGRQIRGYSTLLERSWTTLDNAFMTPYATWGAVDFTKEFECAVNSPASLEITKLWIDMVKDSGPPGVTTYTWYEQYEAFMSGDYLFLQASSNPVSLFEDPAKSKIAGKVGYTLPPRGPNKDIKTHQWTWALGMNAETNNAEAAWLWIQWASSKKVLLKATKRGNWDPVRTSVWNASEVIEMGEKWGSRKVVEKSMMIYGAVRYTPCPIYPLVGDRWVQALQEIYNGRDAKKALDEAVRVINSMVEEQLQ